MTPEQQDKMAKSIDALELNWKRDRERGGGPPIYVGGPFDGRYGNWPYADTFTPYSILTRFDDGSGKFWVLRSNEPFVEYVRLDDFGTPDHRYDFKDGAWVYGGSLE